MVGIKQIVGMKKNKCDKIEMIFKGILIVILNNLVIQNVFWFIR